MNKETFNLKDLAVKHPYYCSDNYDAPERIEQYKNFNSFYAAMGSSDIDMNLCWRWDITSKQDDDEPGGGYRMGVYVMQQRKGKFWAHHIETVVEEDVPNIVEYLTKHHNKMKEIWAPFI